MAVKTNYKKNGNSYYRVSAVLGTNSNGKRILKEFYGKSKAEAEAKKKAFLEGVENGLSINVDKISVGELLRIWLFEIKRVSDRLKPSTFTKYEGIYRIYIENSPLYSMKLDDIKSLQIQRYYNSLSAKGKSKNIIQNINKLLKQFFFYAVDEGYMIKNPCSGKRMVIPGDRVLNNEVEHFTNDELRILIESIRESLYKELILISLGTGLRRGEALALTWDDVDLENNLIKVNKSLAKVYIFQADGSKERKQIIQTPKTLSSNREVPFPRNLNILFKDLMIRQKRNKLKCGSLYKDSNFIFTTESGKNIDVTNLSHAWAKILKNAELPHKKFHTLRHTYATKLFENEVPLKTVSELLGHSSIEMTADIYTHVIPKEKSNAVEKLNYIFAENQ